MTIQFATKSASSSGISTNIGGKEMSKEIFNRIVNAGVRMVLDGANLGLVVATLSRTNGLDPKQALRLKNRLISELR